MNTIFKKTSLGVVIAFMSIASLTAMIRGPQMGGKTIGTTMQAEAPKDIQDLELAIFSGDTTEVQNILASKKLNINNISSSLATPLSIAVSTNNKAMIKLLLDAGADINLLIKNPQYPNIEGFTVLDLIRKFGPQFGNEDTAEFLIRLGARPASYLRNHPNSLYEEEFSVY